LSDREKGFMHYFEMRGVSPSRILKLEIAGNSGELEEKLSAVGLALCDIAAVFVTNSKVHLAAESFKSLCKTPKIIGYDLIPQNIALLKTGVIDFLISQKPEAQGYMAANLLFDFLIKKEQVPAENYISIDIIAAENLDYYSSF
jgi:LacI family transcriptional regulator